MLPHFMTGSRLLQDHDGRMFAKVNSRSNPSEFSCPINQCKYYVIVVLACGEYRTMFSNVKLWLEMQQSPNGKVHKKFVKGIELLENEDTKP